MTECRMMNPNRKDSRHGKASRTAIACHGYRQAQTQRQKEGTPALRAFARRPAHRQHVPPSAATGHLRMTAREAYMEGVSFAARAWDDPEIQAAEMPDEAMQRQFNKGFMDAILWLLCGKMDLNMALLKTREQCENGTILIREAA